MKIQKKRDVIQLFYFQIRIQHGQIINNHLFSFKGAKIKFDLYINVIKIKCYVKDVSVEVPSDPILYWNVKLN
ncbi:hypothetical protein C0J52_09592 [Blattella germanica]|nr:hypothetical protein C0J52_09592 [Blattella germanica]